MSREMECESDVTEEECLSRAFDAGKKCAIHGIDPIEYRRNDEEISNCSLKTRAFFSGYENLLRKKEEATE